MIFPILQFDEITQNQEKIRLDASKSFVSPDNAAIVTIKIKPEASAPLIDVTSTGFLDWVYVSAEAKVVRLEIFDGTNTEILEKDLFVVNDAEDMLFSSDKDLTSYEPDILQWLPDGKSTFNYAHRTAQTNILEWLDAIRVWKKDGERVEKQDILRINDVKQMSIFWTLAIIFMGIRNQNEDVFLAKASEYMKKVEMIKGRGRIQIDINGNGTLEKEEMLDLKSFRIRRR